MLQIAAEEICLVKPRCLRKIFRVELLKDSSGPLNKRNAGTVPPGVSGQETSEGKRGCLVGFF
jgi:hypothetical protein